VPNLKEAFVLTNKGFLVLQLSEQGSYTRSRGVLWTRADGNVRLKDGWQSSAASNLIAFNSAIQKAVAHFNESFLV